MYLPLFQGTSPLRKLQVIVQIPQIYFFPGVCLSSRSHQDHQLHRSS